MPATDSDTEKDARIWSDVIHLMPAWTWQADADFRLRYVNIRHSGLRMTADELIGLRILSPEGQGQDQAGIDRLMQVMRAGQEIRSLSYERVLVNGSRAVLMDSAVPLHDADGRFAGYHGITLNISDVLRKAEVADSLIAGLNRRTAALEQSLVAKAA
ncbi:MAG: PAS domain-containing protein, partial [Mameliella sp.]|nr:PAS domain-containing protein [Mameliella sp.]